MRSPSLVAPFALGTLLASTTASADLRDMAARNLRPAKSATPVVAQVTPVPPPVVAAAPPVMAPLPPALAFEGALDVTAEQPGLVLVDDAEYGPAPQRIEHLPPGPHRVTVRFDEGGESSRTIAVRAQVTTPVVLKLSSARRAFADRAGFHFGFGAEGVFSFAPKQDYLRAEARGGFRAFARASYGVAPAFSVRADFAVGMLSGPFFDSLFRGNLDCGYYARCSFSDDASVTTVPILLRLDAVFHLGSVYSPVIGIDAGVTVMDVSGNATFATADYNFVSGTNQRTLGVATVGVHASLLTFNFGPPTRVHPVAPARPPRLPRRWGDRTERLHVRADRVAQLPLLIFAIHGPMSSRARAPIAS